jgi:hypothetical protein
MSLNEKIDAFIKFLSVVAWPAVILWLAWYLRDEIKRVANRTIEAGLSGFKFAAPQPEQIPSPPKEGVAATSPQPPSQTAGGDRIGPFIANIRGHLSPEQVEPAAQIVRAELDKTFGSDPADQVEGLVYAVASLNIQLSHERNYNLIYGSQLRLMEQMIGGGISVEVARRLYEEAKAAFEEVYRNYTFEQWIGFLVRSGLISVQDANYVLTPYGRGLLRYILDRQLPPNKPF